MWIEDVKDSPIVQEIVRIAGREDMEAAERKGMIRAIVSVATGRRLAVRDGLADELTLYADLDALQRMVSSIDEMGDDVDEFVKEHGVRLPGYGA